METNGKKAVTKNQAVEIRIIAKLQFIYIATIDQIWKHQKRN